MGRAMRGVVWLGGWWWRCHGRRTRHYRSLGDDATGSDVADDVTGGDDAAAGDPVNRGVDSATNLAITAAVANDSTNPDIANIRHPAHPDTNA